MKQFLEDNQERLLKLFGLVTEKTCTIQLDLVRGEIRDGILQMPLEV
jgi:hypothetical protein